MTEQPEMTGQVETTEESYYEDAKELVVLQNENTFSSALMLAVWVQDGGLGTIIGQPGINAPGCGC